MELLRLQLRLLGGLEARVMSGTPIEFPTKKDQGLLAYLALSPGKAVAREKLAGLLWGDSGDKQAHGSLRQSLTALRKALATVGPPVLRVDRKSVALDPATIEVDAVTFQELTASGTPADLEAAVALYGGDLLDGFSIPDPSFESWLEEERRRLREAMGRALTALVEHKRETGDPQTAIALAHRLLTMDPLQERVHRTLMALHGELGEREAALQQYQRCRDLLADELGVAPDAETEALYQALRGDPPAPEGRADAPAAAQAGEREAAARPSQAHASVAAAPASTRARRWLAPAVLGLAAVVLWIQPWVPSLEPASLERMAFPLPDEPSIAVLPFTNMSDDPAQEYFADGMTEDIITDLSKFHDLFVIASNSTFAYKGKPVKIQQVGRELGVRYVLEGSVQRSETRIRINAQLIDADTEQHLWAERYDEAIDDLFDLQDKITKRIVRTLAVRLTDIELDRVSAKPTRNLEAYDYVLKGEALVARLTRAENFEAREMFRGAIELDPSYSTAYAGLGFTHLNAVLYGWAAPPIRALERAHELAQKSLSLDETDVGAHRLLGRIYVLRKQYDLAIVELERAIVLNPNDAASYAHQGVVLVWSSRPDGAILSLEMALRFDPSMDMEGLLHLGLAYYLKGRYGDTIRVLQRGLGRTPDYVYGHIVLAATYGQTDQLDAAARHSKEVRRLDPFFEVKNYGRLFRDPTHAARVIEGLHKAGLE